MSDAAREGVFTEADILSRLGHDLPHWRYENGFIQRTYRTASFKGTLMVINTIGHLAEAAWHHPDFSASYAWVEVRLMTHDANGITEKDFALARKIEDVVTWHPVGEGGLEGTPDDPRFAYVTRDK